MADELDVLLDKVGDASLRAQLRGEIDKVRAKRTFGLVFESHLPERVRLPEHPVRRGTKVVRRADKHGDTMKVTAVRRNQATVELPEGGSETIPLDDLVVVAEFGEPVYPGLTRLGSIDRGGDKPAHLVINAENHHALEMLQFTHAGKVDCIYIDPPYNTGNDGWIYGDNYVSVDDAYRHSKWLAFIERRLLLARRLLKVTGVIIVAIGDDEHHRLRMLLDQVFGAHNFLSDVVWQGGRKNDSRYVSNGADYMLIYAADESSLAARGIRWREEKVGIHTVLEQGSAAWAAAEGDEAAASSAMRAWFRSLPEDSPLRAMSRNTYFLPDGTLCRDADLRSPTPRTNLQYDLLHPVTGEPCRMHPNGWVYSRETMDRLIAEGRIIFRASHTDFVSFKRPLMDTAGNVAQSVFERQRVHAGRHVEGLLGDKRFPFPKDHTILMRWIRLVVGPEAVVLDFFAGSGSTVEAVMRLNDEDGGSRQSIAVTNNELSANEARRLAKAGFHDGDPEWEARGVYEHVTRPRIAAVATGVRPDGSTIGNAAAQNVEFLKLTYLDPVDVELDRAFAAVAPLLWARAGGQGSMIEQRTDAAGELLPFATADRYGVLFDPDRWREFAATLTDSAQVVFVVTDSAVVFAGVAEQLPEGLEAVRLYENYLTTFAINRGSAS